MTEFCDTRCIYTHMTQFCHVKKTLPRSQLCHTCDMTISHMEHDFVMRDMTVSCVLFLVRDISLLHLTLLGYIWDMSLL